MKQLVKDLRQYFALHPRAAFTSDQVRELVVKSGIRQDKPSLDEVFNAVRKLVDQGHLSSRTDPDDGSILYQATPQGIAAHEAS